MRKIEKFIFYIFIFLLPFQIGRLVFSFAPLESFFYHQAFIYLSDVLIFSLLGFWGWRTLKNKQEQGACFADIKKDVLPILFLLLAGLSVFAAANKELAIFHFVKLFEFILFYFYIRHNFRHIDIKKFSHIFIGAALIQVFIADLQFHFQHNIGGILKYLGESPLSPAISGVAKIDEGGFKLIRSYGTFPHPNIFASFLIFAAFMTFAAANDALSNASLMRHRINDAFQIKMTHLFAAFAVLLGLFLTFSKIALTSFIIVYVVSFIFYRLFCHSRPVSQYGVNSSGNPEIACLPCLPAGRQAGMASCLAMTSKLFFTTLIIFTSLFIVFNQEIFARFSEAQSISQRIFYNDIALDAISSAPIFGVGIGNFINYFYGAYPSLPDWQYQPAHNLFLLIASETGIVAGLLFTTAIFISIYRFIKNKNNQSFDWIMLFTFINFLILANFDHYFWTLQQGQILFWLSFGIVSSILKTNSQVKI